MTLTWVHRYVQAFHLICRSAHKNQLKFLKQADKVSIKALQSEHVLAIPLVVAHYVVDLWNEVAILHVRFLLKLVKHLETCG